MMIMPFYLIICVNNKCVYLIFMQWFEILDGLLGSTWKAIGLAFNCTFLLFGSVIQLIACARLVYICISINYIIIYLSS